MTQEQPKFARGVIGPFGKLDVELTSKVDEATAERFRRYCAMHGSDASAVLRDCIYAIVHGTTYSQMVADKYAHEAQRNASLIAVTGHVRPPETNDGEGGGSNG